MALLELQDVVATYGSRRALQYVVALVELEEGVRMLTRLVDVEPAAVRVGMLVEVTLTGEPRLPYFRPRP
jgi:uncharacterized OB-fold protein